MSEPAIVHTHCTHPAARIASVTAKCSDCSGTDIGGVEHSDGFVPSDMGIGGGDYVEFRWCLDCGAIVGDRTGWPKFPATEEE
jgi:hypothetical protein